MEMKTIVVVDDDDMIVTFYRRTVERDGFRILSAGNGKAGLELVILTKPELVILDVMMPIMQGYEVCRYIRNAGLLDTKILMLTALTQQADRGWARAAGADAFLSKPVEVEVLLYTIHSLLENRRGAKSEEQALGARSEEQGVDRS